MMVLHARLVSRVLELDGEVTDDAGLYEGEDKPPVEVDGAVMGWKYSQWVGG